MSGNKLNLTIKSSTIRFSSMRYDISKDKILPSLSYKRIKLNARKIDHLKY